MRWRWGNCRLCDWIGYWGDYRGFCRGWSLWWETGWGYVSIVVGNWMYKGRVRIRVEYTYPTSTGGFLPLVWASHFVDRAVWYCLVWK